VSKHKEVLEITTIQDADGKAFVFTFWASASGIPRYRVYISLIDNDGVDFGFAVDPYSLQKLTAWFAAVRVDKANTNKSIQIQDADGKAYLFTLRSRASGLPRYRLDISVLADSDDGIRVRVDLCGLEKLTAWFAKVVVRVSSYEADHPHS
jgi:hypothetical protein